MHEDWLDQMKLQKLIESLDERVQESNQITLLMHHRLVEIRDSLRILKYAEWALFAVAIWFGYIAIKSWAG